MGPAGPQGNTGAKGDKGDQGLTGLSAYQVAQLDGFQGTQSQWLDSLVGPQGQAGEPYGNIDGGIPSSIYGGTMTLDGGSV
jgi:hypothetical protein